LISAPKSSTSVGINSSPLATPSKEATTPIMNPAATPVIYRIEGAQGLCLDGFQVRNRKARFGFNEFLPLNKEDKRLRRSPSKSYAFISRLPKPEIYNGLRGAACASMSVKLFAVCPGKVNEKNATASSAAPGDDGSGGAVRTNAQSQDE
jgi:hypothetical protein